MDTAKSTEVNCSPYSCDLFSFSVLPSVPIALFYVVEK